MRFSLGNLFRRGTEQDRFARMVAKHFRDRGWPHKIEYELERFALRLDGDRNVFFLSNLFDEWQKAEPARRQLELTKASNAAFEHRPDLDFARIRSSLLPTVRNRSHIEAWRIDAHLGPDADAAVRRVTYQPLCDVLAVGAAVDYPDSLTHVNDTKLIEWEVTFETVLTNAVDNLRARSPASFAKDDGGFLISQYNDYFDCSRLLLPELFDGLSLHGAPVAIPLVREGMLVAGERDTKALLAMAAYAETELAKATRPVSMLPMVLRDGEWMPFAPTASDLGPLRLLHLKQAVWDYQEQKAMLERTLEQQGRDIFVATFNGLQHNGAPHSWAVWSKGVVTLLPRVDAIVFYRGNDMPAFTRSWDDVAAVCATTMRVQAFYPPRFLVEDHPDDAEMARLERDFAAPEWDPQQNN